MKERDFRHIPGALNRAAQIRLMAKLAKIAVAAPYFTPRMPRTGKPFSVRMTNCGVLGWVSDAAGGYRYQHLHPETGRPWPSMPSALIRIWREHSSFAALPEACLINLYRGPARMGSHRDTDEEEDRAPVVSVSLGDEAVFHVGGLRRSDPKTRIVLRSGDVVVFGGALRHAYHGIDRVLAGTSDLIPGGGRINLTLRRVRRADAI